MSDASLSSIQLRRLSFLRQLEQMGWWKCSAKLPQGDDHDQVNRYPRLRVRRELVLLQSISTRISQSRTSIAIPPNSTRDQAAGRFRTNTASTICQCPTLSITKSYLAIPDGGLDQHLSGIAHPVKSAVQIYSNSANRLAVPDPV